MYFSIKQGSMVYLPVQHLGWGDILFFVPLCLLFSPGNLVFFLIFSLGAGIVWYLAYRYFNKKDNATVPLAGIFSLCLIAVFGVHAFFKLDLRSDGLLVALVSRILGHH